jgi:hypothetical protein
VYAVSSGDKISDNHNGWFLISPGFLQFLYERARYFKEVENGTFEDKSAENER